MSDPTSSHLNATIDVSCSNSTKVQKVSEDEKYKIMKKIETDTEKIVITATKTGLITNPIDIISGKKIEQPKIDNTINLLKSIMQSGADKFEKEVGRPMTYSEMRSMYG
jgi:hydroxymethylpyrimidine/phosphomethylpyrimidine kinase